MARDTLDRYYTPLAVAMAGVARIDAHLAATGQPKPDVVVEWHVGRGAWIEAARLAWPNAVFIGVDIDPDADGFRLCDFYIVGDALKPETRRSLLAGIGSNPHIVLGNPPFSRAVEHLLAAVAGGGKSKPTAVAWLLPTRWGGGKRVADLSDLWPSFEWRLYPRIPFLRHQQPAQPAFNGMRPDEGLTRMKSPPDDHSIYVWDRFSPGPTASVCSPFMWEDEEVPFMDGCTSSALASGGA